MAQHGVLMDVADVSTASSSTTLALPLWWHAYLPSAMLIGFHMLLTLLEFAGSNITSRIYWHQRFPKILYPLLTGRVPSQAHTGLWLNRLQKAPFALQCLGALIVTMSPHTLLGALVLYYASAEAHLPLPLLTSSLLLYEGMWLVLLSGQMSQVVPLQWPQGSQWSQGSPRWLLQTCQDLTPLLVLLLACSGAGGHHVWMLRTESFGKNIS